MSLRTNVPWGLGYKPSNMTCEFTSYCDLIEGATSTPIECDIGDVHQIGDMEKCFLARSWNDIHEDCGEWWNDPIVNMRTAIGDQYATNIRLTKFSCRKLTAKYPTWGLASAEVRFIVDSGWGTTRLVDWDMAKPDGLVEHSLDIQLPTDVRFGLYQHASAGLGQSIFVHIWGYAVSGLYDTPTPLEPRQIAVAVNDPTNGILVANATVQAKIGDSLIRQATTGADGQVTLQVYNQIYQVIVMKAGYVTETRTVDCTSQNQSLIIPLAYVGCGSDIWCYFQGLMDWIWVPIVIGGVGLGFYVVSKIKGRRRNGGVY